MIQNSTVKVFIVVLSTSIFSLSCQSPYKAGNLISLHYPVETRLKTELVKQYVDSLIQNKGYNVPFKWLRYDKLVDLDSTYNKRIYFSRNPEEMYLVSSGGMLSIEDVYNPSIIDGEYVAERERMPAKEEQRVKIRFQHEILDVIEKMARQDGLPDSLIYK
jgi:hypothetical protein